MRTGSKKEHRLYEMPSIRELELSHEGVLCASNEGFGWMDTPEDNLFGAGNEGFSWME